MELLKSVSHCPITSESFTPFSVDISSYLWRFEQMQKRKMHHLFFHVHDVAEGIFVFLFGA